MTGEVAAVDPRAEEALDRMGRISAIRPGEEEAVARFYAGFEREARPLEFWRRRLQLWWRDNPAYHEGWPLGTKMTAGGKIVGVIAAVPTRILYGGEEVVAASLTTWRVEKNFRSGSIGMFEAVLADHSERMVVDGTPTPGVVHLLRRYGFEQPRDQFAATRFVCNWWRMLKRRCGRPPAALLSSRLYLDSRPATEADLAPLVDDLWQRTRTQFATASVRDSTYLHWFCQQGRMPGRFGVVATGRDGRAAAMAIGLDMGGGVAWLVDIWGDFNHHAGIASVISRARSHARRLGFHSLWVPHFHPIVAGVCGEARSADIPASAFFRLPAAWEKSRAPSFWSIASGDFGV